MAVASLVQLCENVLFAFLEKKNFHPKLINDLCKRLPHNLLENILEALLDRGAITDVALVAFLVPERTNLRIRKAVNLQNSTLKQIGYHCANLLSLDLSECVQVSNSVVQAVLQGCSLLSSLKLDRCHRVTDSAFDMNESLFYPLIGCLSLEAISLQECPQITGGVVVTLNKMCGKLKFLNLSQCKHIESKAIQQIFEHHQIISLNLSFVDGVSDDAFYLFPFPSNVMMLEGGGGGPGGMGASSLMYDQGQCQSYSPLQKLNLGKSTITDQSIFRMAFLSALTEINLQWCGGITDAGVAALTRHCARLALINLQSCNITDAALHAISRRCRYLINLDVSWCQGVTDAGISMLSHHQLLADESHEDGEPAGTDMRESHEPATTRGLQVLGMVWCQQLTDASLSSLRDLRSLVAVEAGGCSAMSERGCDLLRECGVAVKFS